MDSIIAAIITGVAAVLAALVGARWGSNRTYKNLALAAEETNKSIQEQSLQSFGWKARGATSRLEVVDSAGDSKVNRTWKSIQPNDGFRLTHIPGRYWLGTPGAKVLREPKLYGTENYPKEVSLVTTVSPAGKQGAYRVEIANSLTEDDPPLDFGIEIRYERGVLMNKAEVEKAYAGEVFKRDYHAFDLDFLVDRLTIEVVFPQGLRVRAYPAVFFGRSELANDRELQRVKAGFDSTSRGGRFVIDQPIIGLRYLIYWSPPKVVNT